MDGIVVCEHLDTFSNNLAFFNVHNKNPAGNIKYRRNPIIPNGDS